MAQPVVVDPGELVEEVVSLSDVLLTLVSEVEVEIEVDGSGLVVVDALVSEVDDDDDDDGEVAGVAVSALVSAGLSTKHAEAWRRPTAMATAMTKAPRRRESPGSDPVDLEPLSLAGSSSPDPLPGVCSSRMLCTL